MIKILRGDGSSAVRITPTIPDGLDLAGAKLVFECGGLVFDFADFQDGVSFTFPREWTSRQPVGRQLGRWSLVWPDGRKVTTSNTFPVYLTDVVSDVGGESRAEIALLENAPLEGLTLDPNASSASLLTILATAFRRLGGTVAAPVIAVLIGFATLSAGAVQVSVKQPGEFRPNVDPVVTAVDLSGLITTNDVCSIVTNEVVEWTFTPQSLRIAGEPRQIYAKFLDSDQLWLFYAGSEEFNLGACALPGDTEIVMNSVPTDEGDITVKGKVNISNALGIATLKDLPPLTNGIPTRAELETGWWSEWTVLRNSVDVTAEVGQPRWNGNDWSAVLLPGETIDAMEIGGDANSTELEWKTWEGDEEPELIYKNSYIATRHRVAAPVPMKPSDIGAQPAGDYAQASVIADIAATVSTNSADIATLNNQVTAIGAHLNAEDAHFVSTNYDSVVRLPEAYVEIKMRDEATGSNTWITIWQEMRRWTAFVGSAFDWQTWDGFHTWATNVTAQLNFKADRCWGIYNSETGEYSPEGFTQIASSNILIASGMAYQRTVTSGGAVWILRCNQGVAQMGGATNGFFQVFDGDGVVQFEIVKGDRRELGANADGITVDNSTSPPTVTIPYSIVAPEHPTLYVCDDLATANWKAETDPDCVANVSWPSTVSGEYVATIQRKTAGGALFVKATYMAGGETYIRNAAPMSVDGGIFCTDGIHKVRPVYSNGSITLELVQ